MLPHSGIHQVKLQYLVAFCPHHSTRHPLAGQALEALMAPLPVKTRPGLHRDCLQLPTLSSAEVYCHPTPGKHHQGLIIHLPDDNQEAFKIVGLRVEVYLNLHKRNHYLELQYRRLDLLRRNRAEGDCLDLPYLLHNRRRHCQGL